MIKPDIVVCWPRNCDYPLWRQFIRDNRSGFNLVIVVFTETNQGQDYREFVRNAMEQDYVLFIENRQITDGEDWRNVGVNAALLQSYNAEWIWFTEQDFIITDPVYFWDFVEKAASAENEFIAVKEGERTHPCCMFVKRTALTRTKKNFAANPPGHDHFGQITKDMEALKIKTKIIDKGYLHLNGLSQNMNLLASGQMPNYYPEVFWQWLLESANVATVDLDDRFLQQVEKMRVLFGKPSA